MRLSILFAFLLALLLPMPVGAEATSQSSETIQLAVGAEKPITLSENPSAGYSWHIDKAESSNLAAVRISDAGYHPGASHLIGAPGTHSWQIEALAPGKARIVFDYFRSWEHFAPARRHTVEVEITQHQ